MSDTDTEIDAFDVPTFCRRNGISRTTAYKLARAGQLTMRKVFNKTVVTRADEAAYRQALAKWQPTAPPAPDKTEPIHPSGAGAS